jgi:hypothetical protein
MVDQRPKEVTSHRAHMTGVVVRNIPIANRKIMQSPGMKGK